MERFKTVICDNYWLFLLLFVGAMLINFQGSLRLGHTNALRKITWRKMNHKIEYIRANEVIRNYNRLAFAQCVDVLSVADPKRSKIELIGNHSIYIGDTIRLYVTIFDGYGRKKSVGGDHLQARLYNTDIKAFTAGHITDQENGTYTVNIEALWTGQANIEIELLFPKELIATILRLRKKWNFSGIRTGFKSLHYHEETICNSDRLLLERNSGRVEFCNLSYWNNTMPWYCVKPVMGNLTCNDVVYMTLSLENYANGINTCENQLARRNRFTVAQVKHLTIYSTPPSHNQLIDYRKLIPCTSYNITKLWLNRKPSGFFYNGKWILRHCKGESTNIGECLRNGAVYLWGDSTLKQWIEMLKMKLNSSLQCNSSGPENEKWKLDMICYCKQYNLILKYVPHNLPAATLHSFYDKTLQERLEFDENIKKRIIIIHLYAHLLPNSLKFFAAHIFVIRKEIEQILAKEPKTIVFIKLPHTHRDKKHELWQIRQPDYLGYLYTSIIREIFDGLFDRIIALNNNDATIAVKSMWLHPAPMVVSAMVDQFLNYICDSRAAFKTNVLNKKPMKDTDVL